MDRNAASASRLYIGNLPPGIAERDLEDEFGRFGHIRSVWVARKPPGFAFLEFEDERDAQDAVRKLDGHKGWRVELSRRGPRSGGGPPGGGGRDRGPRADPYAAGNGTYGGGGTGRSPPRGRSPSPVRRRRSPSYERERRRSPSYERKRSPSPVRRDRERSPIPRSPSPQE